MIGPKTSYVSSIVAILIICYDASYLLVNLGGGNGGAPKAKNDGAGPRTQSRLNTAGIVGGNLRYKIQNDIKYRLE